jgi:hypothetical protein
MILILLLLILQQTVIKPTSTSTPSVSIPTTSTQSKYYSTLLVNTLNNEIQNNNCNNNPNKKKIINTNIFTQPKLCHPSHDGQEIDCTIFTKYKTSQYFNFEQGDDNNGGEDKDKSVFLWTSINEEQQCTYPRTWKYRYQCVWCPTSVIYATNNNNQQHVSSKIILSNPLCRTGRLIGGRFNDDHDAQVIDGADIAMRRSYRSFVKPDFIRWKSVFLKCEFMYSFEKYIELQDKIEQRWLRRHRNSTHNNFTTTTMTTTNNLSNNNNSTRKPKSDFLIPLNQPGKLYIQSLHQQYFELSVNPRQELEKKNSTPSTDNNNNNNNLTNIICGRALYGDLHPQSLIRFTQYYHEIWKFSHILVYEVGLSRIWWKRHPDIAPLLKSGILVVIDLRDALYEIYGDLISDVTLFSTGSAQTLVKADCINRARLAGVAWTLHVDYDEILVQGGAGINSNMNQFTTTSWNTLLSTLTQQRIASHKLSSLRVLSFGSLPVIDSTFCSCKNNLENFNFYQWFKYIDKFHLDIEWPQFNRTLFNLYGNYHHRPVLFTTAELEAIEQMVTNAPFECSDVRIIDASTCTGAEGRRKLAIRVDEIVPRPFGLGIHEMSSCTYGPSSGEELTQTLHNVLGSMVYLRHYRCMNFALFCDENRVDDHLNNNNNNPWFGPVSPIDKRHFNGWEN